MFKANDTAVPKCFSLPDLTLQVTVYFQDATQENGWNTDLGNPSPFQYTVTAGIKTRQNIFHCNREKNPDFHISIHKTAHRSVFWVVSS